MHPSPDDKTALDVLAARMYAAFRNENGAVPDLDILRDVFLPDCVIAKMVEPAVQVQGLDDFIEQRRPLLRDGRLVGFSEWETDERTWICGNIASRCSLYAKSGVLDGVRFDTRGIKNMQFVKLEGQWRISALAWDDERDGLAIPPAL
jgi:hypothetical protein